MMQAGISKQVLILAAAALFVVALTAAQSGKPAMAKPAMTKLAMGTTKAAAVGGPVRMSPDRAIAGALAQVSAAHVRATIEKLVSFHNRSTLSADQPASSGRGVIAARDWLKSRLESYSQACGGCMEVKLDTFTQQPGERVAKPTQISNVYAVLKGTDPAQANRVFLVSGHYDSRDSSNEDTQGFAPGANDDASGTSVSLECARVLSQLKFPATIIFLTVAGEEQGLYGSHHFAELAKKNGWQVEGMLNNDIVGGNRTPGDTQQNPRTVRVFSEGVPLVTTDQQLRLLRALGGENDSASRELSRFITLVARTYLPPSFQPTMIFRLDRYLRGGDDIPFDLQGFPAVRFTEWREDFHHQHQNVRVENGIQYGDLPQYVNFDYVANVARLNAATLAALASAPPPPENVRLLTKELENNSTLAWNGAGGDRGYEVVWRATDAPNWQHETSAGIKCENGSASGGSCQVTLPISKDNVIFGVRAVDAKGHKGPAVMPLPQR